LFEKKLYAIARVNVVDENQTLSLDELHLEHEKQQQKFIRVLAPDGIKTRHCGKRTYFTEYCVNKLGSSTPSSSLMTTGFFRIIFFKLSTS
jgi:hypothetical protein